MVQHELEKPINLIIVGDTYVGKSSLVASYARNEFPTEYTPTVFDSYTCGEINR